jgi:beta-mannosidase
VELSIAETDTVFSDNYFDIPAGAAITVTCPLPEGWIPDSKVSARSLYDSF